MPHILTPPSVLEAYAANHLQEQRDAACLFVDTAGFTPLTSALMAHGAEGAEVLAQVLADIFTPLLALVDTQGGYVAGFAGDAFKAIFPGLSPESHQRAVTTAWQIREQMATHPVQRTRFGDFRFAVKITIASGPVEWRIWRATDNSSAMAQQAALLFGGSALAQALAADPLAQAGEIVVTAAVAAHLSTTDAVLAAVADHFRLCGWSTGAPSFPTPATCHLPSATRHSPLAVHFFPTELLQRQTQGEFRQVVTLFVNLQALPSGEPATSFAATLFRLLAQYGGYLCRIGQIGDRDPGGTLLLFWGAPTSHENDVARALHFALALQTAAPTPIRIGVTTALAYAGFVGSPLREEYTCYGLHVNLAARQMVMAGWGEIWLDEETAHLADAAFTITAQATMRFKGFAEERTIYRLLHHQTGAAETFYTGMLVGRAAELAQLYSALAPLAEGKSGGLITIIGEAGMGKSRLVYELQRQLEDDKMTRWQGDKVNELDNVTLSPLHPVTLSQWFRCQTDEILRQPLNPFRYWLRAYFNQSTNADDIANKATFTAKLDELIADLTSHQSPVSSPVSRVSGLVSELDRTRSFLGALVDLYWPDSLYAQVEPQLRLENTLAALKSLILADSLRRPVILHLEDAHWLDADSQSFLTRLLQDVAEYPLAVIITRRPVEETGRQGDKETGDKETGDKETGDKETGDKETGDTRREGARETGDGGLATLAGPRLTIRLATLTEEEIRALTAVLLPGGPPSALVNLLLERAEGNPFFVEQLVRYLQEAALLVQGMTGWQLRSAETISALLPTGVRALLVARLDRLSQPVKEVVQTAAVLGREFDTQVLAQMLVADTTADTTLADKLVVANQAGIWTTSNQTRYLFRHALLREAAYEMQLRARLRSLHRRAAAALQVLFAERLEPYFADLAYHYDRAEVVDEAGRWYGKAGAQAASGYANRDAARYFNRAIELTPGEQAAVRFNLFVGREAVYEVLGNVTGQRQDISAMETIANQLADPERVALAALRSADHLRMSGDYPAALLAIVRAAESACQTQNFQLMSNIQQQWGRLHWEQGEYSEGRTHLEAALAFAQSSQHLYSKAKALIDLGTIHFYQGEYELSKKRYLEALALNRSIGECKGEGSNLAMLGTLATQMADYEAALTYFQQAEAIFLAIGYSYGQGFTWANLGLNYIYVGQYHMAQSYLEKAIGDCQARHYRLGESIALDSLALMHLQLGNYEQAMAIAQQAKEIQQTIRDQRFEAYSLTYIGEAHYKLGDFARAERAYEEALTIRRQLKEEKLVQETLAGLAQVRFAQGQMRSAVDQVMSILRWLEEQGLEGIEFPIQLYLTCFQIFAGAGESASAWRALQRGYQLLQQRANRIQDQALRTSFLETVSFNREVTRLWLPLSAASPANSDLP